MSTPGARLSAQTLSLLPAGVRRPAYDRAGAQVGVVHFGPGAFHRAHQAAYFDDMLALDPRFAVCAVSLRSDDVRAALEPQDGLYALLEREAEPTVRVIGALKAVLTAPRQPAAVFARLLSPQVRLVTVTVTEKGYGLTPGGDLNLEDPAIRQDLAAPGTPSSLVGWIVEGLRRRRADGVAPFAVLSCDNLADNSARLRTAVLQFAAARGEADLAAWIAGEASFPCTMVDSITPATDAPLRESARQVLGLEDAWPIQRERFAQWVVENTLPGDTSAFADAGVVLASDVAPFERAKLRLLNGAHSTLAYLGLLRGHELVSEAMADAALAEFVAAMMREEIVPGLTAAAGLDLPSYVGQLLARFQNPAIAHRLSQIAWDGSQKLPFRLVGSIEDALAAGRPFPRLATAVAAWLRFVRDRARRGEPIVDPLAERLADIGRRCTGEAKRDVSLLLELQAVFPPRLVQDARLRAELEDAYRQLSPLTLPSPRPHAQE